MKMYHVYIKSKTDPSCKKRATKEPLNGPESGFLEIVLTEHAEPGFYAEREELIKEMTE